MTMPTKPMSWLAEQFVLRCRGMSQPDKIFMGRAAHSWYLEKLDGNLAGNTAEAPARLTYMGATVIRVESIGDWELVFGFTVTPLE